MGWIARILTALLVLYWLGFVWPFLQSHAEQDQCSFGPVTNVEYRALLKEAKRQVELRQAQLQEPPEVSILHYRWVQEEHLIDSIRDSFDRIAPPDASLFVRLAAMHAVLRAHGGAFRAATGNMTIADEGVDLFTPEFEDFRRGRVAGFTYIYYVSDPWLRVPFYPLDGRDVTVNAHYYLLSESLQGNVSYDTFRFAAMRWEVGDKNPEQPVSNRRPNCPPVPTPEWLDRYTATLKSLKE